MNAIRYSAFHLLRISQAGRSPCFHCSSASTSSLQMARFPVLEFVVRFSRDFDHHATSPTLPFGLVRDALDFCHSTFRLQPDRARHLQRLSFSQEHLNDYLRQMWTHSHLWTGHRVPKADSAYFLLASRAELLSIFHIEPPSDSRTPNTSFHETSASHLPREASEQSKCHRYLQELLYSLSQQSLP